MPNYDYQCNNCGYTFETFQTMSAEKLTECPKCHKHKLQRLIGAGSGLIFKGTGFYLTDYKNKSSQTSSASTDSGSENFSKKDNSVKSESKTTSDSNKSSETKSGSDSNQKNPQNSDSKSDKKSSVKTSSESKKK